MRGGVGGDGEFLGVLKGIDGGLWWLLGVAMDCAGGLCGGGVCGGKVITKRVVIAVLTIAG